MHHIVNNIPVCQHHAFGIAGCARGIDDGREIVLLRGGIFTENQMARKGFFFGRDRDELGLLREHRGALFAGLFDAPVLQRDDGVEVGIFEIIQFGALFLRHKRGDGLGMADDVADIGIRETGEDGHGGHAQGGGGQIGDDPIGTVVAEDHDAVAFFEAVVDQQGGGLLDVGLQLVIGERLFIEKSQCRKMGVEAVAALHQFADVIMSQIDDHDETSVGTLLG